MRNGGFSVSSFFKGFLWILVPYLIAGLCTMFIRPERLVLSLNGLERLILPLIWQMYNPFFFSGISMISGLALWGVFREKNRAKALGFLLGGFSTLLIIIMFAGIGCGLIIFNIPR